MPRFYDDYRSALLSGKTFALATVVRIHASSPREPGAKMGVFPDRSIFGTIGGGKLEKMLIDDSLQILKTGKPVLKTYTLLPETKGGIGTECGGTLDIFIDIISAGAKIMLIGAGHISHALAGLAETCGFAVEVVDDRTEFANSERFPRSIIHNTPIKGTDFKSLINSETYVVIVSHSHEIDYEALKATINLPYAYLGMIGSQRKVKVLFSKLLEEGIKQNELDKIHAPIGLDINAETPEEIALSIMAEIVAVKRSGTSTLSMSNKIHAK
ncbi:MAG: XdhC family protein [Planctomycetes bacterium]|nr:XdhC family protein [Planctomycetota bacterium]